MVRRIMLFAAILVVAGCGQSNRLTGLTGDDHRVAPKIETVSRSSTAPVLSGYQMVKASQINSIYDRNGGDYDWLVTFNLPVNYCPAARRVFAMTWYGVWYEETGWVQLYSTGVNPNGTFRMSYLFGNGKAMAYGIYMSPSNWALYYR